MPTEKFSNNGASTLNGAINSAVTSLVVTSAVSFPTTGNFRILIGTEIIIVGTVTGSTFSNLSRGAEGTTAASHSNGDAVTHILTAGSLAVLPRSLAATGDIEYLNGSGTPVPLAAPTDGNYALSFTSSIPSYNSIGNLGAVVAGSIMAYGGSTAPSGYQMCDGSAINRVTFATLFAIIGTTFGVGDGATTFNVPDLRQRFPMGKANSGTGSVLGSTGGTVDHTHTGPSHTHTQTAGTVNRLGTNTDDTIVMTRNSGATWPFVAAGGLGGGPGAFEAASAAIQTGASGTGATGTANPPYQSVNFIIKT